MSKPISFGFGKPKSTDATATQKSSTSISLPAKKTSSTASGRAVGSRTAFRPDEDDDLDEHEPKHESVTGFSSTGAVLGTHVEEKKAPVIENPGNQDWRQRGRGNNASSEAARQTKQGRDVVMVEKDEVSTASGLQFALDGSEQKAEVRNGGKPNGQPEVAVKPVSADEEALQALLGDDDRPRGSTVIEQQANTQLRPVDETDDFRADVASRPNSSTLEEYAAMPVEEFGIAMLRGMGKKRRANGEVINLDQKDEKPRQFRKQEGFLGIGAKAAPGMDGVELGAWGKADMRKNSKGAGFFTPLMLKNKETGETITEEELDRRKREAKESRKSGEEDWRERRDKNLAHHGRGRDRNGDVDYRNEMSSFSRRTREESGYDSSRSRRDKEDSDRDSSRSKRHRSRSRDRRKREEYDDQRYKSSSTRRDRERDGDRHRYRGGEETDRRRERESDRDDRRHRDRR